MDASKQYHTEIRYKAIAVFAVALLLLLYRVVSGTTLFAMIQPLYLFAEKETFYSLFYASQISQYLTSHWFVARQFDIVLLILPIVFAITLNRIYAIAFSILLLIYFLIFNMVTGHHYHSLVGAIVITIPFWFKKPERFNLAWDAVRYYFLYIFASAALWKILRGSVFYTEQLSNTLKSQQLDLLIQNPGSFQAHAVQYLIAHPQVSHWVLIANVLLQLFFLVGFFTKRFDAVLFWLAIIFCVANYFVMSIVSAELLILNLTLLNWNKIEEVIDKFTTKTQSTLSNTEKGINTP